MSGKIQTIFAIRDTKIMEDTLKKLGYCIDQKSGKMIITSKSGYAITLSEDQIECDTVDKREVDNIKIEYSKAYAVNMVESKGELYTYEETEDQITILVN
jgi:hypothetical protein